MDTSNMGNSPELNQDLGFVKKKYASKKVVRGPDGTPQVVFVDTSTGQVIQNPKGYTVIESSNVVDPVQQLKKQTSGQVPLTKGQNLNQPTEENSSSILNEVRGIENTKENPNIASAKQTGQSLTNQYGYTNKPTGMGLLGFLPQPIGLMATATNIGVNAKNTEAVNDQREALGFTKNPTSKNVMSSVIDQQGYIGDQATVDNTGVTRTTPVSFEAVDSVGRTSLTPEEARMREALNPEQYSEASQAAVDNARNKFAQDNPGWGAALASSAKGLFSSMFGSNRPASMAGTPGVGAGNPSAFPGKPSPPDKTTAGVDTGRGPTGVDTTGYSPGLW